jgi:hypothetical protein
MKQWIGAALLACVMGSAQAEGVLSCQDVDEIGTGLTEIGILLDDENAEIGEGSEEDQALAEIAIGIAEIADAAEDEELGNAGVAMAEAWAANDRDAFLDALGDVIAHLALASAEAGCE